MAHKARRREDPKKTNQSYSGSGTCDTTGKAIHETRARARVVRNRLPDGSRMTIYRCDDCGHFHLGHKPDAVRNGDVSKATWLGRKR